MTPTQLDARYHIGNPLPADAQIVSILSYRAGQVIYNVIVESASFDNVTVGVTPPRHDLQIKLHGVTPLPLLRALRTIIDGMP